MKVVIVGGVAGGASAAAVPGATAGAEDDVSKSGSIHLERAA